MLLRRAARRHGFADPLLTLGRMRRLTRPSSVHEPIELVRAGAAFHARGLLNTRVFQFNLDWIWPHWVSRQYDPLDAAFLPRAFSFSHVNLTHRNWSALGLPGMDRYPIVDPRGMVTLPEPLGWSLDWWFLPDSGDPADRLFPSRAANASQRPDATADLGVETAIFGRDCELVTRASVTRHDAPDAPPMLELEACVVTDVPGRLLLAVRPVSPEGVGEIGAIQLEGDSILVDDRQIVRLGARPEGFVTAAHGGADLHERLAEAGPRARVECPAGLATGAAVYDVVGHSRVTVRARVPLVPRAFASRGRVRWRPRSRPGTRVRLETWTEARAGTSVLSCPDERWERLHRAAIDSLILLSPGEVFPGPWTYRRFWFRDACLMLHGMLAAGLHERVGRALRAFRDRQKSDGFFHSQEGEWDSNGQVLWIADLFEAHSASTLDPETHRSLVAGAEWIVRKRTGDPATAGLLPPGFSAEHLGPVDQYYWDDFWGLAGLHAASRMAGRRGDAALADRFAREAVAFAADIRSSLDRLPPEVAAAGIPASPHRRMDAGAIGSLVADHPLQLPGFVSGPFLRTADWLRANCCATGGFFQDMIHSGTNAYLTLALAQTFLRHGDPRHLDLVQRTAGLASSTGHWPEAIHPHTHGGCMGDGQHGWAAAEWLLMMRALFVREEADHLVLGSGIPAWWRNSADAVGFGPTSTRWGRITIRLRRADGGWRLEWDAAWHAAAAPPRLVVAVPGFDPAEPAADAGAIDLRPSSPRFLDANRSD